MDGSYPPGRRWAAREGDPGRFAVGGGLVPAVHRKRKAWDGFLHARRQMQEMEEHLRSAAAFADEHAQLET